MRIGKIPESVLKRSVLRQRACRREEILQGALAGEDCAAAQLPEGELLLAAADPVTAGYRLAGRCAVYAAANDIAAGGGELFAVLTTILLPPGTEEQELRELVREIGEACRLLHAEQAGGHTEVTSAVTRPVLQVTGLGRCALQQPLRTGGLQPGDAIVMTKWAGMEGTAILAAEKEAELQTRFAAEFIRETAALADGDSLSVAPEARIARDFGVHAMHDVSEGGIYAALWELGQASKTGLCADIHAVPVRQETIEVCEFFDINPYQLMSAGSLLIGAADGSGLVRALGAAGIPAVVIGRANESNDRVIVNGEDRRFLTPPAGDEIYRVMETDSAAGMRINKAGGQNERRDFEDYRQEQQAGTEGHRSHDRFNGSRGEGRNCGHGTGTGDLRISDTD